jgi:hypothetical protein
MRNVFDQYSQPENRLTHALVSALAEDKKLLRAFVRWITGSAPPKKLFIDEQSLPGEPEILEGESEKRGLPDAWIHDDESWSLLIESKVSSPLKNDQLRRHLSTAEKRGYEDIQLLAIDVGEPKRKLPDRVLFKKWSDIYTWLIKHSNQSDWARRAAQYMEIVETKLPDEGYLKEGTLTMFSRIPFDTDNPFNYQEAKRILKLAMEELRKRKDLVSQLNMNPKGTGRGAITGKDGSPVWDFLRIHGSKNSELFTKYPHLTLGFRRDLALTIITIPHGITPSFRRNVVNLGYDGFVDVMRQVNSNLSKALRNAKGAAPWVEIVQRRYPSQRSTAIIDARLEFDLRTAFPSKKKQPIKTQTQWLQATYDALTKKRSNLQVAVGAIFPYNNCPAIKSPEILGYVAATWIACKPLLDVMFKK